MARAKGREGADWGVRNVSPGWHKGEMGEIEVFEKEDTGARFLMFRIKVVGGDDDGLNATIFAPFPAEGKTFGEQKVADILNQLGVESAFNEKFPEDKFPSFFVDPIIKAMQARLPGIPCQILVELDKKNYTNVRKLVNASVDTSKLDGAKAGTKAEKGSAKTARSDDSW